ncbi:MAG: GAF domain-containing protein [Actinomycetes bacterium]
MEGHRGELVLDGEPDDVPRARRFTRRAVESGRFDSVSGDAAMVVTELVTNALLHARPPVVVRVVEKRDGLRVEVADRSPVTPMRALAGTESMTGRGLRLVDALANRWGVDGERTGKVVWCELSPDHDGSDGERTEPAGRHPGALNGEPPSVNQTTPRQTYTISLGDAPTDLLLAAKAHVDNLVRELTLVQIGASAGHVPPLPPRLVQTIETVVTAFGEARRAIKRLAVKAAEAGRSRTELVITVSEDAMVTGEAYLSALDEADAYARAGRLLTLETPPEQRVFRRWYVQSLVEQLRAVTKGEAAPPAETFEHRLLEELRVVSAARRTAERSARLQQVTSALARVNTVADVARVVVQEGVTVLSASSGCVLVPRTGGEGFDVLGAEGYMPEFVDPVTVPQAANLPVATALRDAVPVWVRTPTERDERFPFLATLEPLTTAVCALPLVVRDEVFGVLRFGFAEPQPFDDEDKLFLRALAVQTSGAVERALLHDAESRARASAESLATRLERLQQVTAEMVGAADDDEVSDIIVTSLADALGAVITTLAMVDGDQLRLRRVRGARPEVHRMWETFPLDANLPASEAARTGEVVVVPDVRDLPHRYPLLAAEGGRRGSLACLPLAVGNRILGVVSLSFPEGASITDPGELRFLQTLAHTCAQALARASATTDAREANERLALLAEASAELAGARGYRETLSSIARLVVPRLADWCSITLLEDGVHTPVARAHANPERLAKAQHLLDRFPPDPRSPVGTANVVRTGRSELYPKVTEEMLQAGGIHSERLRLAVDLGISSVLIVPLTGRTGTLGAIQLVYAESGRHFRESDRTLLEDLGRRAAVAVENAQAFETQKAQLASISRVAAVAQHAILAPVPSRCGPVRLAGTYVSATRDASIGGDYYEVVTRGDVVRLLIGDVRGKGLDAVRLATVLLGLFRAAAHDYPDIRDVARQMEARVQPYLADEDFVTALLVDVTADGTCTFVSCGHPAPLLGRDGALEELSCSPTVPLGLGVVPEKCSFSLRPHDRLLLFTDGLIETRNSRTGEFLELEEVAQPLTHGELGGVLGTILQGVQDGAQQRLSDDLAMLVVEYDP